MEIQAAGKIYSTLRGADLTSSAPKGTKSTLKAAAQTPTIDPTSIQGSSGIPPTGAVFVGVSPQDQVSIYHGTVAGDVDAAPSAQELLKTAPDTGGLTNADYIYSQISKLNGGVQLPVFTDPNGNQVKSLIYVSGSSQGPYGAFHIDDAGQTGFDKIVVDSLNASGNYSTGSSLIKPLPSTSGMVYNGPNGLFKVTDISDPRLQSTNANQLLQAIASQEQSNRALMTYLTTGNPAAAPSRLTGVVNNSSLTKAQLAQKLTGLNQSVNSLMKAVAASSPGRQYLSTALYAAELTESFEQLGSYANAGQTDGEALSRWTAFSLAPEIALVPGFNSAVTQQWWQDGHPDWVNNNSQSDQSTDGNAAGVMFLGFLNHYLGIPLDQIIKNMPATQGDNGSPLGDTYVNLTKQYPKLAGEVAQLAGSGATGATGQDAFNAMINLLTKNAANSNGTLNLPANGDPYLSMPGAVNGGLYATAPAAANSGKPAAVTA
jgi:hypothetical protein